MTEKKNVIWNMIYSLMSAGQSALLLLLVNRTLKEEAAGVFALAFSVAVFLMYIGNYGIRNFQVSDVHEKYTPGQYYSGRILSMLFMAAAAALIPLFSLYTGEKLMVLAALTVFRMSECAEDVFHGRYQQKGDLYLAGMQGTARLVICDIVFAAALLGGAALTLSSWIFAGVSVICVLVFSAFSLKNYGGFRPEFRGTGALMRETFPLFLNYLLIAYLMNVSKYALDHFSDDTVQAYYGILFTPVFVVNLLSTMIFRPMIVGMAEKLKSGDISGYRKLVRRQELIIPGLGILMLAFCAVAGLPLLSLVYGSDVTPFMLPFMLLLAGGICSAYSSFLNVCLVTLRGQRQCFYLTALTAAAAAAGHYLIPLFVKADIMTVTAAVYLGVMALQALLYMILHARLLWKREKLKEHHVQVGLLTVYSFNYGSFFQAVSLYRCIESLGYECELVNERFKRYQWGNLRLLYAFHDLLPSFARGMVAGKLPQYRTYLRLAKDVAAYRQSPESEDMESLTAGYDRLILGADELWSASPRSIRYTPEYFGRGISCPHSSYATSGCLFDLSDETLKAQVRDDVNSFEHIAVRDEHTAELVRELTGREALLVPDPALLYPWYVKEAAAPERPYVLLYGSEYDEAQRAFIKERTAALGAEICALGWPQDFADRFLDPESAEEFQNCFAAAAYCFPATFHGTVFSIVHHKDFVTMGNELRGAKINMLLEQTGLTDRLYGAGKEYGPIDYAAVEERLDGLRQKAYRYLKEALKSGSRA